MIKISITTLVTFILLISCSKEKKKNETIDQALHSKNKMLEDYSIFQSIYEKANAGLYKYYSKEEIDSVFMANRDLISEETTYREFYNVIWNVIDFTGSSHNSLSYPDSLDELLNSQNIFFPLPLKYIEGKLYANINSGDIPAGSEIISVNGIDMENFSRLISKYVSTDGMNKTGKYANIETDWLPFYIYLAIGEQKCFDIEYRVGSGKDLSVILPSITYKEFYGYYEKRHSRSFEERNSQDYSYDYLDDIDVGILNVNTFSMGGPASEGHKQYAKFIDSVFINIKENNVQNLLVDVRGNGGGHDPNDLLLYSYLTPRSFRENTSAFTLFTKIPLSDYYLYDDVEALTEELIEEHSIFENGKYYQNENFNRLWQPNENVYKGKITLLIDPFVASAGALFASLIKSDERTVIIGEETLGGYYGHTGHIPVDYELPNSKLILSFSIVDLEQDVMKLEDQDYGDGVKPDFMMVQSHEDFMKNIDTQLNYAISKITSSEVGY